jgi:hypothetical protein
MGEKKYAWILPACILSITPFIASKAFADPMDGSKNMACAIIDVVACMEGNACIEDTAGSFELPELFIYDSDTKNIRATFESGHKEVSPVKNLDVSGDHLIMQGVENGRAWNFAIDTKTGHMSSSGVGDAVSFLMFGTCTSL